MGLKGKILGALKNLGGCMGTPKADKNESMKKEISELRDPPKDEEEEEEEERLEVAKGGVKYSKNIDGVAGNGGDKGNIVGNQVPMGLLVIEEVEEKETEESTIKNKPFEDEDHDDEKEIKINNSKGKLIKISQ